MCAKCFSVVVFIVICCVHHSHQDGNLSQDTTKDHNHEDHHHELHTEEKLNTLQLWLASTGAIFAISLCGVFGVMVIPITGKVFYQHLIQFLVALAVGTLSGDALLHLIPHALMVGSTHSHEEYEKMHASTVWKGFTALMSLLVFFFFEKMINILGEWRENQAKASREKKVRIVRSGHKASDRAVGERLCKHKYSSYCVTDIDMDKPPLNAEAPLAEPEEFADKSADAAAKRRPLLLPALSDSCLNATPHRLMSPSSTNDEGYDTVFIREHEHVHHGHSHAHSHLHSAPDSISSVAWMVVFGDGIHNLADGMAIGAAFTESPMSGLSTTIAVLCHELPHEIGDFAMLLKAGMTVKQAIFYNILSSVLAFIGMVFGILLGELDWAAPWIFMATAGIFLYVALVDMIPELNSGHAHPYTQHAQHESHSMELILQILGMATGAGIMLIIALYEHELKEAFH